MISNKKKTNKVLLTDAELSTHTQSCKAGRIPSLGCVARHTSFRRSSHASKCDISLSWNSSELFVSFFKSYVKTALCVSRLGWGIGFASYSVYLCLCMCTRVCPCGECVCVFVNSHWLLLWEFITPKVPYPSTCVNCRSGTSQIKVHAFDRFLFGFAISCSDKFFASEILQHLSLLPWLRTISARFLLFVNRLRLFLWFFYVFVSFNWGGGFGDADESATMTMTGNYTTPS